MKICRPRPQLVFTFDNRFSSSGCAAQQSVRYIIFRLQASYWSATSHTGRESCRVKSLYMKRFWEHPPDNPLVYGVKLVENPLSFQSRSGVGFHSATQWSQSILMTTNTRFVIINPLSFRTFYEYQIYLPIWGYFCDFGKISEYYAGGHKKMLSILADQ